MTFRSFVFLKWRASLAGGHLCLAKPNKQQELWRGRNRPRTLSSKPGAASLKNHDVFTMKQGAAHLLIGLVGKRKLKVKSPEIGPSCQAERKPEDYIVLLCIRTQVH